MSSEDNSVGDLAHTPKSVVVTTITEAKLTKGAPALWRFLLLNFVLILLATAAMLTVALLATLSSVPTIWLGLLSTIGWFGMARSARHKLSSKFIVVWLIVAASGNYSEDPLPIERITAIYLCSTAFPWLPHYLIMSGPGQLEDYRDCGLYGAIQQTGPIGVLLSIALQWASGMLVIPLASRIIAERPLGEFEAIDKAVVKWILLTAALILLVPCWWVIKGRASDGQKQLVADVFSTTFLTSLNYIISLGSSIEFVDPDLHLKAGKETHVLCTVLTIAIALIIVSWNSGKKYPEVAFRGNVKNFVFDGKKPPISLRDTLEISEKMQNVQWRRRRRRYGSTSDEIDIPASLGELVAKDVVVNVTVSICCYCLSSFQAVGVFIAYIGWVMIGWCTQDGEYSSSLFLWSAFVAYGSPCEGPSLLVRPLTITLLTILFVFLPLVTSTRFVDLKHRGPHLICDIVQFTKLNGPLPLVRFVSCTSFLILFLLTLPSALAAGVQVDRKETSGEENPFKFFIAGALIFLSLDFIRSEIREPFVNLDISEDSAISEASEPPEISTASIVVMGIAIMGTLLNVALRLILSKEFLASATGQVGSVCINLGIEAVLIVGSSWHRRQRHADQYDPDDSWRVSDFCDMFIWSKSSDDYTDDKVLFGV